MGTVQLSYREWVFIVDKDSTEKTYNNTESGGAEACGCDDCKGYVSKRESIFPDEIKELFIELGIDYRKEVEITTWEKKSNGQQHIGGWFHFKGEILKGRRSRKPISEGAFQLELVWISNDFAIGFDSGNDLTFFDEKEGLVQVEFEAFISESDI